MWFSRVRTSVLTIANITISIDEWFSLRSPISQIMYEQTPTSPNSISPRDDNSTHFIHLMKLVVLDFKNPHGLI